MDNEMDNNVKHFNKGIIFGKLSSFRITNSEPKRMNIILDCPNSMHGDPRIYATAFGDMADRLQDVLKTKGNGSPLRLQGVFSQYEHKERMNSSFTVFDWTPYQGQEYRAVFILVGSIEHIEKDGEEWKIHIRLSRTAGKKNIEEDFLLYADNIGELTQGQTAKLKGVIARKEDYFGDAEGSFKPYVKQIDILKSPEEGGPF